MIASGCFLINNPIEEYYSRHWHSGGTENAKYRGVFVKSPTIIPGQLRLSDSVELRVTDAWVERPTHVEYRWVFLRREIQDSGYRFVIHLAQVPQEPSTWTQGSFVPYRLLIDGKDSVFTGNSYVHIAILESETPFPDVVHLSLGNF
jgi:hypothetical protein